MAGAQTVSRTAKSVGSKSETYTFSTDGPAGIQATPSVTLVHGRARLEHAVDGDVPEHRDAAEHVLEGLRRLDGRQGPRRADGGRDPPGEVPGSGRGVGTGTTGSLTYNARSGYAGDLQYSFRGLQAAEATSRTLGTDPAVSFNTANPDGDVAAGKANVSSFTTPAGRELRPLPDVRGGRECLGARPRHVRLPGCSGSCTESYALVATSGGPDANEFVGSTSTP